MSASKQHVQGSLDGLCGVYSLVHYIMRFDRFSERDETHAKACFRAILRSAERLSLLKSNRLVDGFYNYELVSIFNHFVEAKQLAYRAIEIEELEDRSGIGGSFLIRSAIDQGGAAVIDVFGGRHWVLADAYNGDNDLLIKDSGHDEERRKAELKRMASNDGLVLLPNSAPLLKAN